MSTTIKDIIIRHHYKKGNLLQGLGDKASLYISAAENDNIDIMKQILSSFLAENPDNLKVCFQILTTPLLCTVIDFMPDWIQLNFDIAAFLIKEILPKDKWKAALSEFDFYAQQKCSQASSDFEIPDSAFDVYMPTDPYKECGIHIMIENLNHNLLGSEN